MKMRYRRNPRQDEKADGGKIVGECWLVCTPLDEKVEEPDEKTPEKCVNVWLAGKNIHLPEAEKDTIIRGVARAAFALGITDKTT